jgi:psp operon transcriptional activator
MAYSWPGNVRELRNVVERAVYRWLLPERPVEEIVFDPFESPWKPRRETLTVMPSPAPATLEQPEVQNLRSAVEAYEHSLIEQALMRFRWNQRIAASALGVTYDQLRHAMKRHGLIDQALRGGRQPRP